QTTGGRVGYEGVRAGPSDVLDTNPPYFPVDLMWDEPRLVRFLNGLSSFSRHIWFDQRGTGASDWIAPVEGRLIESIVDDMVAVLDELGCERVVVLGASSPLSALQFAATHPERTSALVLINPYARFRWADDYPGGLAGEAIETAVATIQEQWGTTARLRFQAPSLVGDARFGRWLARCERLSMTPQDAYWQARTAFEIDVRHLLGSIRVPTLVVARAGYQLVEARSAWLARYVAEHIDDARFVELPGDDYWFFVGDTTPVLDAIEEFITGRLATPAVDPMLATVLFTDRATSTEQVA